MHCSAPARIVSPSFVTAFRLPGSLLTCNTKCFETSATTVES